MQTRMVRLFFLATIILITFGCGGSSHSQGKYIKGLVAVDVYLNLEKRGFDVQRVFSSSPLTSPIKWICKQQTSSYEYEVVVYGDGPSSLTKVEALVLNYSQKDIAILARGLLGYIASIPYEGSDPAQAREWVEQNVNNNTKTVIAGVSFEIFANSKGARILEIKASPEPN